MNPSVLQYHNCWKWEHFTFVYKAHSSKCWKYERLHKIKHYRDIAWYYKTNSKVNLLRLKTKVDEPYPHSFKYFNYKKRPYGKQ